MKVKICGQTSVEDCRLSLDAGADLLGVVLDVDWSPRSQTIESAFPLFERYREQTFLLLFNKPLNDYLFEAIDKLRPCALQLTGQASPEVVAELKKEKPTLPIYKSIHLQAKEEGSSDADIEGLLKSMVRYIAVGATGFVLDTACKGMYGGTGKQSDWGIAAQLVAKAPGPVFLAGGINPCNVTEAVRVPSIAAIDLASGVEYAKGKKSPEKLMHLFAQIKAAGVGS